jgi:hypothetical protein
VLLSGLLFSSALLGRESTRATIAHATNQLRESECVRVVAASGLLGCWMCALVTQGFSDFSLAFASPPRRTPQSHLPFALLYYLISERSFIKLLWSLLGGAESGKNGELPRERVFYVGWQATRRALCCVAATHSPDSISANASGCFFSGVWLIILHTQSPHSIIVLFVAAAAHFPVPFFAPTASVQAHIWLK